MFRLLRAVSEDLLADLSQDQYLSWCDIVLDVTGMGHFQTALTFSQWALEFFLFPPFALVAALLAISLVWAGKEQRPFQTRLWKPYHWLVVSHLTFFAAAILVGAVALIDVVQSSRCVNLYLLHACPPMVLIQPPAA